MPKTVDADDAAEVISRLVSETRRQVREEVQQGSLLALDKIKELKEITVANRRSLDRMAMGSAPPSSVRKVLIKAAFAKLLANARKVSPETVVGELFAGSPRILEATKNVPAVMKAVTNPAGTDVPEWAGNLGHVQTYGMLASLAPQSVYSRLVSRGVSIPLAGMAGVKFPARKPPPDGYDAFVGEGLPIPVRALDFTTAELTKAKKAATISLFTGELLKATAGAAEIIIGQALSDDIGLSIDTRLLSDLAADATHPAGLLVGATEVVPSTNTDPAAAANEDIAALVAVIQPSPLQLTFIASAKQAATLSLLYPGNSADIIATDVLDAGTVVALDSSDFASVTDGGAIDITEDANVISRDDPAPISQGTSGAGADTASPNVSLWQQNLHGIRCIEFINWTMRRTGRVSYVEGVAW